MRQYQPEFGVIWTYRAALFEGLRTTVLVSVLASALGTLGAIVLVSCRSSRRAWLRVPSQLYIETFLALPLLVLLIWVYYCLPLINPVLSLGAFSAAVVAISMNAAAFIEETLRVGIESIPRGYGDAAHLLGLSRWQFRVGILMPLAVRRVVPALLAQYVTTIKLSSMASIISVYELLHSAENLIAVTFRPLEVYTTVAIGYLLVILPLSFGVRLLERKIQVRPS
jgi:polar amino acid transport system permease protein